MSLARSGIAALAALALVPASASAAGGSCAKPFLWKLSPAQLEKVERAGSRVYEFRRGPAHVSVLGNPLSSGPTVVASTSGPWRICSLSGQSGDGRRWSMPGTWGGGSRTSFARRQVRNGPPEKSISVAYARRGASSGGCRNPSVTYYSSDSDRGVGDPGASLSIEYSGDMQADAVASWALENPSAKICRVEGYSAGGEPWVVGSGGTSGSHVMHEDSRIGTHSDPVLYFWVAFTG